MSIKNHFILIKLKRIFITQPSEGKMVEEHQDSHQWSFKLSFSSKNLENKEFNLLFANPDRYTSNNHPKRRNPNKNINIFDKQLPKAPWSQSLSNNVKNTVTYKILYKLPTDLLQRYTVTTHSDTASHRNNPSIMKETSIFQPTIERSMRWS